MPDLNQVKKLWDAHRASSFPSGCADKTVNGIELVLLDADSAGCVESFLKTSGLDQSKSWILQGCVRDLQTVSAALEGESCKYFRKLLELATQVQETIASK